MVGAKGVRIGALGVQLAMAALAPLILLSCSNAPSAPPFLEDALGILKASGLGCSYGGSVADTSGYGQWECVRTLGDGTVDTVFLDVDSQGIRDVLAVRDVSGAPVHDAKTPDLFTLVATVHLGPEPAEVAAWVDSHADSGGRGVVGSVLITLDNQRQVRHLTLYVED